MRYIAGMADGSIVASKPATAVEGGFRFPSAASPSVTEPSRNDGTLRFAGSVTLTGHGGMLKLVFTDPWLVPGSEPNAQWLLTIADPYEPVSYTHLDVYKRQTFWRAAAGMITRAPRATSPISIPSSPPSASGGPSSRNSPASRRC